MPLPKLETPTYELSIPSTQEKITFRPFLVKEYKILLTVMDSDVEEIHRVITDLVEACTFGKVNVSNLPSFDIEYLFLNIRAKSIGETTNVVMTCENCENKIETSMDLTKSQVITKDGHEKNIKLTEDMNLEMRYPSFREILKVYDSNDTQDVVNLISSCIDTIYTKDEYFKVSDYTKEELDEFINSFSKEQFDKLENFFITMPKLQQKLESSCKNCGTLNSVNVEGLQNFFA